MLKYQQNKFTVPNNTEMTQKSTNRPNYKQCIDTDVQGAVLHISFQQFRNNIRPYAGNQVDQSLNIFFVMMKSHTG